MIRKMLLLAAGAGAAYWYFRGRSRVSPEALREAVAADRKGNYDLDGVSYDKEAHDVVVSGDATHEESRGPVLH